MPVFQKKAPNDMFIVKLKKIHPCGKTFEFKYDKKNEDFPI